MKLLLDTNIVLWLAAGSSRVDGAFLDTLDSAETVFVSDISLLEISIKISIGKLAHTPGVEHALEQLGITKLRLDKRALTQLETLPLLHRDPFDRAIVAQAMSENAVLVTGDKKLASYDLQTIIV